MVNLHVSYWQTNLMKVTNRFDGIALLLVWSMLLLLTACGGTAVSDASSAPSEAPKPEENQEPESTVMSTEDTAPEPELEYTLPIHDDSISISYWISWNPDLSAVCAPGDASVYKALENEPAPMWTTGNPPPLTRDRILT